MGLMEHISRRQMARARLGGQGRVLNHDLVMKSASELLHEIFPQGVPSQGALKQGIACIAADIKFKAVGCGSQPWHGFIVDDVVYMYVTEFFGNDQCFRNAIMALMELTEDVLGCSSLIIALPKTAANSDGLARAFLYSGFEIVNPLLYQPSSAYILVGYDAM
ncbi:hypothetical protein GGI12_002299 [Dipsacomyces acuminosporus]|nr:hypothetical protein GGI12_002299 [Dipsacomyces acuminosporus]